MKSKAGILAVLFLWLLLMLSAHLWLFSLDKSLFQYLLFTDIIWWFVISVYTMVCSLNLSRRKKLILSSDEISPVRVKRAESIFKSYPWKVAAGAISISLFVIIVTLSLSRISLFRFWSPLVIASFVSLSMSCIIPFLLFFFFRNSVMNLADVLLRPETPSVDRKPARSLQFRITASIGVCGVLICAASGVLVHNWLVESGRTLVSERLRLVTAAFTDTSTVQDSLFNDYSSGDIHSFRLPATMHLRLGRAAEKLSSGETGPGEVLVDRLPLSDHSIIAAVEKSGFFIGFRQKHDSRIIPEGHLIEIFVIAFCAMALLSLAAGAGIHRRLDVFERSILEMSTDEKNGNPSHENLSGTVIKEFEKLDRSIQHLREGITGMRETQQAAIQSRLDTQQMKSQFFAGMSHDLRSPLNSIIGFAELMLKGIEGGITDGQRKTLEIIHKNGEGLLKLISSILDSAKLEAGRLELLRQWVPAVEIIAKAVNAVKTTFGSQTVDISYEIQAGLPPVYVDEDRIVQAIMDVLLNAVNFLDTGVVFVRTSLGRDSLSMEGQFLLVEVMTRGVGADITERKRLEEAIAQRGYVTFKRSVSLGLGIYLAKSIIEMHGGTLYVETEDDEASLFKIGIPLEGPEVGI